MLIHGGCDNRVVSVTYLMIALELASCHVALTFSNSARFVGILSLQLYPQSILGFRNSESHVLEASHINTKWQEQQRGNSLFPSFVSIFS